MKAGRLEGRLAERQAGWRKAGWFEQGRLERLVEAAKDVEASIWLCCSHFGRSCQGSHTQPVEDTQERERNECEHESPTKV